jgi:SAM-dependent methyltransferase
MTSSPPAQLTVDAAKVVDSLPALADGAVALVALDGGRALLPALRHRGRHVHDIVLEEWATSKDELPEVLPAEGVEVSRTDKGDLRLPDGASLGLVVFADSYHRIWEPTRILGALRDRMGPGARLVVLDRRGPDGEPRRLAGHRRRISPSLVREELAVAGFEFAGEAPSPSPDRFLLIFAPGPKQRLF